MFTDAEDLSASPALCWGLWHKHHTGALHTLKEPTRSPVSRGVTVKEVELSSTHLEEGEGQLASCRLDEAAAEEEHQAAVHLRGGPVRVDGDAGGYRRRRRWLHVGNRLSGKIQNGFNPESLVCPRPARGSLTCPGVPGIRWEDKSRL